MSAYTEFIAAMMKEDIGDGDHSSLSCIPSNEIGTAKLVVKEPGIIAGVKVANDIFHCVDPEVSVENYIKDGTPVQTNEIVFVASGKIHSLLKTERLMLNIMQRMSGIATTTNTYVECLKGLKARVLDTRKTSPGLRFLEKEAVRIGGGLNHRMGLYDMIMLKDNHIDFAGGISQAVAKTRKYLQDNKLNLKLEVEVRNLDELRELLASESVDRVLLDNFDIATTREAVAIVNSQFEIESSGGITLKNLRSYGECGVDYISVGALTHSVRSLDLSFKAL